MANDIRQCGFWEATCKTYHEKFKCSGQVIQNARFRGPLTEEMVKKALYWLQRRHPLLQAKFAPLNDEYDQFVMDHYQAIPEDQKIKEVPLRIVSKKSDDHWKDVTHDVLDDDCTRDSNYLWTVTYVKPEGDDDIHDFVCALHHSISDGKSNAQLMRDLLQYCADIHDGSDQPSGNASEACLPPVEKMIPNAVMKEDEVQADLVSEERGADQNLTSWPFENNAPLEDRRTRNLYCTLDHDVMNKLVPKCREHGISVNSALVAAIISSVCDLTEEEQRVMFSTAISLRDNCQPVVGMEHFGCYVMVMQTFHNLSAKTDFWDLAKDCDRELKSEIKSKTEKGFMPAAFDKREVERTMVDALTSTNKGGHFPGGCVISNLGVLKYEESYGKNKNFHLLDLRFSTTQNAGNFNFLCWALTLFGRACLCFSYTIPLFSEEKAKKIAQSIEDTIKASLD